MVVTSRTLSESSRMADSAAVWLLHFIGPVESNYSKSSAYPRDFSMLVPTHLLSFYSVKRCGAVDDRLTARVGQRLQ
jgi:hypothetical protein